jgi:hypothetical protein
MSDEREQFRQRLLDYLYGELEGAELAAFEAQLAESQPNRDELAALQRTLETSRAGLAMLEEAPPARISRTVNNFAQAHAEAIASERSARAWHTGVSSWLRKPIWAGALGVSAVVALVLIIRAPKSSQPGRSSELPDSSPAAPAPLPASETPESSGGDSHAEPTTQRPARQTPPASIGAALPAEPEARPAAPTPRRTNESSGAATPAAPEAQRPVPPPRTANESSGAALPAAPEAQRPTPAPQQANRSSDADFPAKPEVQRPNPTSAMRHQQPTAAKRWAEAPLGNANLAAPQPQPSAADEDKASARSRGGAARKASAPADGTRAAATPEAESEPRPNGARANDSEADALVRVAHEHMTTHRFAEAAAAYEVLLQRFPRDARASEWRRQLRLAARAETKP